MDLIHRPTEERDLAACFDILEDRFSYDKATFTRLPHIAAKLLAEGAMRSAVLEDLDQPPDQRLMQFGATVFVTDEFARQAAAQMTPHLSAQVVANLLQQQSPILSQTEIAQANARDGLNLLVLHFGITRRNFSDQDLAKFLAYVPESFLALHQGYQLKEIVVEFCEESLVRFSRESGFRLRTDYREFYDSQPLSAAKVSPRPQRLGITREEAYAEPGSDIARIFPYQHPRFFFAPGEQELLLRALQGETDDEAAENLRVAVPTVKTRWRTLYDRVEMRNRDLFAKIGAVEAKRGTEKRRLLLNYLRQHPEELRPYQADRPRPLVTHRS